MKLVVNRGLLIRAMGFVVEIANRHRLPILGNIKLVLDTHHLTLTTSDLEVELTCHLALPQGACHRAGEITVPAEKFFSICKLLPEDDVCFEVSDDASRCHISSGKSNYSLGVLPASDFPSIGQPQAQKSIKVSLDDLSTLLRHTRFAMATQDVRHYLTGLLLEIDGEQLTAVATDGHRLAVAYRTLFEPCDETRVIIPGKAVSGLERLLLELIKFAQAQDMVELGIDDEFLCLALNFGQEMTINLTARLIDGKFPDYRRVLPTNNDKIASFSKDEMVGVLRRISVLNTKESPGVLLGFSDGDVATISSNNREQDEAVESLAVAFTGEPIEISFNESYLRAVLNVLEGQICLQMVHPNSPTLIYQVGDESRHQYVVMPMRV
ncbi:MAG: DNA polymerase III subunit beta [Moraxella sp.]|nr:DNA polymerase III subunit beta [Moraxella sp.]